MRKLLVAVENENDLTDDIKKNIEDIARERDAEILGIMVYPHGLIESIPEAFMDGVQKSGVDFVAVTSPGFIINELTSEDKLSAMAEKKGVKIIDANLNIDLQLASEEIPEVMIDKIIEMVDMAKIFKNSMSEKVNSNILVIANENSEDLKEYISTIQQENECSFNQLIIGGDAYDKCINKEVGKIIDQAKIGKIYVYCDFNSEDFDQFMNELSEKGLYVYYRDEALQQAGMKFS